MKSENNLFEIKPWHFEEETCTLSFHYECSKFGAFQESFILPQIQNDINEASHLLNLLSWLVGISYYKANVSQTLKGPLLSPDFIPAIKSFYQEGLGEFFVRNKLDYPYKQDFIFEENFITPSLKNLKNKKALVAFGGGKDSYVALDLLRQQYYDVTPFSVISSDKIKDSLQNSSLYPLTFIKRAIDPKIIKLNNKGALNGHVPITAILSVLACVYARLNDYSYVVFANEHAASEATMIHKGTPANHQFSKSLQAEKLIRDAIKEPYYFSALRGFSELKIAKLFSAFKQAHPLFLSCNKNFQITSKTHQARWCHKCPKCASTYLLLSPFLNEEELAQIFTYSILDDEEMIDIYRDLLGLTSQKPWECVGSILECRAAFYYLSKRYDFKILKTLTPELLKHQSIEELEKAFDEALAFEGESYFP